MTETAGLWGFGELFHTRTKIPADFGNGSLMGFVSNYRPQHLRSQYDKLTLEQEFEKYVKSHEILFSKFHKIKAEGVVDSTSCPESQSELARLGKLSTEILLFLDLVELKQAIEDRNVKQVQSLLTGDNVKLNAEVLDRENILHQVVCSYKIDIHIVKALLDRGVSVNKRDDQGRPPLWCAKGRSSNREIVKLLESAGATEDLLLEETTVEKN